MELFTGTKLVKARTMNRGQYNTYRGWDIPKDENPNDEGYLVEYINTGKSNHPNHEGYVSWSPLDVFNEAYNNISTGIPFGSALELLEQGSKLARSGWNGKNMFVYHVPAATYPTKTQVAKTEFGLHVDYGAYLAIKTVQGVVNTWVPSISDILAKDWVVIK
ncbi:hypothetical protein BAE46_00870 [Glaciecola punicea]|uniref:DUF2829 domain-containing protein n=1 Tax=Glaciecola punicea TaxID=56804 RepID=UPI000872C859|nr:DUF2829 domain-containing protein [Glaciecola punicea]OFA33294.1 hypothetical protein BAE46_00870 [Glaciecola punicea]